MAKQPKPRPTLFIDQYGSKVHCRTVKQLRETVGGKVSKIYVDGTDGKTYHVGWRVGQRWFRAYTPLRNPQ